MNRQAKPTKRRSPQKGWKKPRPGQRMKSPPHVSQNRILQQTKVYVMHNIPYFWVNKFGITDHEKARRQNVSVTTPGYVFYLFAPTLEFGWHLEQFIHGVYRFQNVHFWTGSGRREWFVVFSPIVGTLTLVGSYHFGWSLTWKEQALAYFMPFVWLDGLFWLAVFFLGRLAIFTALFLAGAWVLAHSG